MDLSEVIKQVKDWQTGNLKVVLATGVFDVLHVEHFRFLKQAKKEGDRLIVGLERDDRVKEIKGHNRPINNQLIRLEQINSLKAVDIAFLLPEKFKLQKDWEEFMEILKPNIYAVSSHTNWLENKKRIVEQVGGRLQVVHEHNPNYSSSNIIKALGF